MQSIPASIALQPERLRRNQAREINSLDKSLFNLKPAQVKVSAFIFAVPYKMLILHPMDDQDIIKQFQSINTWKSKGIRAPHKPLLMLLALGELVCPASRREDSSSPKEIFLPKP